MGNDGDGDGDGKSVIRGIVLNENERFQKVSLGSVGSLGLRLRGGVVVVVVGGSGES